MAQAARHALISEWRAVLAVALMSVAVLLVAEAVRRLAGPEAEWTRKLVHFCMGVLSASLPWVFASPWPVLVLCAALAALLGATQVLGLMRSVHGVSRVSGGVLYYPVAVALLFFLTADEPGYYVACILVMTVCDTAAALIGSSYGRFKFVVQGDTKSLEGSVTFFLTAFSCLHVPLLLLTSLGRPECVLIAAYIALLVTVFEALSIRGIDNFIVPYGAYFILERTYDEPAREIGRQIFILLAVAVAVFLLSRLPKSLMGSAVLAVILMAYGTWALGDFTWFFGVALVVGWFCLLWASPRRPGVVPTEFELREVFHVFLVPFLALWAANAWKLYDALFLPFLTALATAFGLISYAWLGLVLPHRLAARRWGRAACSALASFAVVLVPTLAVHGAWDSGLAALSGGAILVSMAVFVGLLERGIETLSGFLRTLVLLEGLGASLVFGGQSLVA